MSASLATADRAKDLSSLPTRPSNLVPTQQNMLTVSEIHLMWPKRRSWTTPVTRRASTGPACSQVTACCQLPGQQCWHVCVDQHTRPWLLEQAMQQPRSLLWAACHAYGTTQTGPAPTLLMRPCHALPCPALPPKKHHHRLQNAVQPHLHIRPTTCHARMRRATLSCSLSHVHRCSTTPQTPLPTDS